MGLLLCARPPCLFVCRDVAKLSKGGGERQALRFLVLSCVPGELREDCGGLFSRFSFPVLSCALIEKGRRRIKDKAETKKR